jgi:DNA-binding NarL/FixJ family response regulator
MALSKNALAIGGWGMQILLMSDRMRERTALRRLLKQDPALNVIEEAGQVGGFLERVQDTQPDLVLLDWELVKSQVTDLAAARRALDQTLKIVAFGQGQEARQAAVAAGVNAFVSRKEPIERLLNTYVAFVKR